MSQQRVCLIMRGLPGCGKSYYLRQAFADYQVVSADHYFTQADGSYHFDQNKLQYAHEACFRRFLSAMLNPPPCTLNHFIAVDNTNVDASEIAPYYMAATALGFKVLIVHVLCTVQRAETQNTHNVPVGVLQAMLNRFGSLPPRMRQLTVPARELPELVRDLVNSELTTMLERPAITLN